MTDTFSIKDIKSNRPILPNLIPEEESSEINSFSFEDIKLICDTIKGVL